MKRILIMLLLALPLGLFGQIDTINIGTAANNGTGESLRSAMIKVNNFMDDYNGSYLYQLALSGSHTLTLTTTGNTNVTLPTSGTLATLASPSFTGVVSVEGQIFLTDEDSIQFETGGTLIGESGSLKYRGGGLDIGNTGLAIDSVAKLSTGHYAVYDGADTIPPYIPVSYTDDPADLFPEIHAFAGDTSNYATPDKIGDLFINTATSKVYVSVSTSRGGWVILNVILPLFLFIRRREDE